MDAAEQHRLQVNRWFYDCSPEFHRNLGDLYVSDPRYVAHYDEAFGLPGLAQFCRDASMRTQIVASLGCMSEVRVPGDLRG